MRHTLFAVLSVIAIALTACKSSKEVTQQDLLNHGAAIEAINQQSFMVKGQRLSIKHHTIPSVSSSTNFVVVDGNKAVVQVSPGYSGGPNGVGGFTVEGNITGYEVKAKDNGEVNIKYHVQAIAGSCDVTIKVMRYSDDANVHITSTFKGGSASMYGKLMPIDNSIYKGRSRY